MYILFSKAEHTNETKFQIIRRQTLEQIGQFTAFVSYSLYMKGL